MRCRVTFNDAYDRCSDTTTRIFYEFHLVLTGICDKHRQNHVENIHYKNVLKSNWNVQKGY